MKSSGLFLAACVIIALIGCGKNQSPLPRLEKELPLKASFGLTDVKCNGEKLAEDELIHVNPGSSIRLSGVLSAGEWPTTLVEDNWTPDAGEASRPQKPRRVGDRSIYLILHIHGNNVGVNTGVVNSFGMQTQFLKNEAGTNASDPAKELKADFSAPSTTGVYVVDFHAVDESLRKRGETDTRMWMSPFWRRELVVE